MIFSSLGGCQMAIQMITGVRDEVIYNTGMIVPF